MIFWDVLILKTQRNSRISLDTTVQSGLDCVETALFNYPPLRRQHIASATSTTHELMMQIFLPLLATLGNKMVEVNLRISFKKLR